jgi:hypothetical protein
MVILGESLKSDPSSFTMQKLFFLADYESNTMVILGKSHTNDVSGFVTHRFGWTGFSGFNFFQGPHNRPHPKVPKNGRPCIISEHDMMHGT